jgi:hypothetical protein
MQTIAAEVRALIRRMASENRIWGQRRIKPSWRGWNSGLCPHRSEMRRLCRKPSLGWREYLKHARDI